MSEVSTALWLIPEIRTHAFQLFGSGGVVGYAMTTETEEKMPVIGFDMVRSTLNLVACLV